MAMNKRGLIGKILLIIGILIVLLIGFVAITAYQAYSFINFIKTEAPLIQTDIQQLGAGDCSKVESIESRMNNIKKRAKSTCKNPLIRVVVNKLEDLPFNCNTIETSYESFTNGFENVKTLCANS
jgi:hypothetical protein